MRDPVAQEGLSAARWAVHRLHPDPRTARAPLPPLARRALDRRARRWPPPRPRPPCPPGTPSQASNDGTAADAGFSGSGGLWGDLAGGVAARPYIRALSVVNGGVSTPRDHRRHRLGARRPERRRHRGGGAPSTSAAPARRPLPGQCYATPNRVGITFGYANNGAVGTDFADPETPAAPDVGPQHGLRPHHRPQHPRHHAALDLAERRPRPLVGHRPRPRRRRDPRAPAPGDDAGDRLERRRRPTAAPPPRSATATSPRARARPSRPASC